MSDLSSEEAQELLRRKRATDKALEEGARLPCGCTEYPPGRIALISYIPYCEEHATVPPPDSNEET